MDGDRQLQKITHRAIRRVKSGCHTCRIRKVKCDEDRPACKRCMSTGRICGGYGVWGGGGNDYSQRSRGIKPISVTPCGPVPTYPTSTAAVSTEEKALLDWFKFRTAVKLPGIFVTTFWDTLIFQASEDEPAVRHGLIALGAVHKSECLYGNRLGSPSGRLNEQEKLMLQHYSKAISYLQPRCSIRNKASIRVALVACVVFVCIELVRGHYRTALTHLQNGIKLLQEVRAYPKYEDEEIRTSKLSLEPVDYWIAEALSSLHTRARLFDLVDRSVHMSLLTTEPELPARTFASINQAKFRLDWLLNKVFILIELCRDHGFPDCAHSPPNLLKHQQTVRAELASWLAVMNASKSALKAEKPFRNEFGYLLLRNYHTLAIIMADICLSQGSESQLDFYTEHFTSIVVRSIKLWKIRFTTAVVQQLVEPGNTPEANSVTEMGWIPPIYYVAVKCRVHRIRLQAIRLLEASPHREGIWVATIAAAIARKVMEMEERDFYHDLCLSDDFALDSYPEERDMLLPTLPEQNRIHEVKMYMPDDPVGKVKILYRRRNETCMWKYQERVYDISSRSWGDEVETNDECLYR